LEDLKVITQTPLLLTPILLKSCTFGTTLLTQLLAETNRPQAGNNITAERERERERERRRKD